MSCHAVCSGCGHTTVVSEVCRGREVTCPRCKTVFTISAPAPLLSSFDLSSVWPAFLVTILVLGMYVWLIFDPFTPESAPLGFVGHRNLVDSDVSLVLACVLITLLLVSLAGTLFWWRKIGQTEGEAKQFARLAFVLCASPVFTLLLTCLSWILTGGSRKTSPEPQPSMTAPAP